MGMQGIVVSNHGGREVDGAVSSLAILPDVVDAVGYKLNVLFDSEIRSGADIAKAMALGTKMCLIEGHTSMAWSWGERTAQAV